MIKRIMLIASLLVSPLINAEQNDVYAERETLSRVLEQIQQIRPLVELSKSQSDLDRKHRFDYSALNHDLLTIQQGISHYLASPLEPRRLLNTDLSGDYRTTEDL